TGSRRGSSARRSACACPRTPRTRIRTAPAFAGPCCRARTRTRARGAARRALRRRSKKSKSARSSQAYVDCEETGADCTSPAYSRLIEKGGADGRTRTDTAFATAPSRQRVYQFHHVRVQLLPSLVLPSPPVGALSASPAGTSSAGSSSVTAGGRACGKLSDCTA